MIAFRPLSVTHGAPSGPTITPWGLDPGPRGMWRVAPVAGSRRPSAPAFWAVYQTLPSGAGATSCGWEPAGTGYSRIEGSSAEECPAPAAKARTMRATGRCRCFMAPLPPLLPSPV